MNIRYTLSGGLDDAQMQMIHQTALRILDEVGMELNAKEVPTGELLTLVSSTPGVRIAGNRIHFTPSLVEKYLGEFKAGRKREPAKDPSHVFIHSTGHAFHYLLPLADRAVPNTVEMLVEATRLIDALYDEGVRGGCPGRPSDVHPFLQDLMQYKITCQYSRNVVPVSIQSTKVAPHFHEMAKVMGTAKEDDYFVGFHPLSPLRLEGDELEIALLFWKKFGDKLALSVGPMPIMGVSSPIFFPAALAQGIAEALGGFTFFKILTHGGDVEFFFNFYAFDMKNGTFVYGGPEDALIGLVRNQMTQWYGMPNNAGNKALNTMAHAPDAHAASEKMGKSMVALLAGATSLVGGGGLSLDETFSPEQMVLDVEIVNWAKRVSRGFELNDQTMSVDLIKKVIQEKIDFLAHESTLEYYRQTYWDPTLFEHLMLKQWDEKGQKALRQRASELVRKKIAGHSYELGKDQVNELDKIYRHAEKSLS